jgi:hypothetical protein
MQPELRLKDQGSIVRPVLTHNILIDREYTLDIGFRYRQLNNSNGQVCKTSSIISEMRPSPRLIRFPRIPANRYLQRIHEESCIAKYSMMHCSASGGRILASKFARKDFAVRYISMSISSSSKHLLLWLSKKMNTGKLNCERPSMVNNMPIHIASKNQKVIKSEKRQQFTEFIK